MEFLVVVVSLLCGFLVLVGLTLVVLVKVEEEKGVVEDILDVC